jgi:hypothetical protein
MGQSILVTAGPGSLDRTLVAACCGSNCRFYKALMELMESKTKEILEVLKS